MIESDYIVRMFTLLGRALAKITLLKETKNAGLLKETKEYEEAAGEVEQASRDLLGLTVEMMRRLPIADLHKLFGSDPAIARTRFYIAGLLLRQVGDLAQLSGKEDESIKIYLRTLSLIFEYVPGREDLLSDRLVEATDFLLAKLDSYDLPASLKHNAVTYYENRGMYSKCEDIIFEVIEEDPEFLQEAVSLYGRLLAKSDADLEKGDLPRAEVEQALSELRSKQAELTSRRNFS